MKPMTDSDKTTIHMLQRAMNVDHYLLANWDDIVKIKKASAEGITQSSGGCS